MGSNGATRLRALSERSILEKLQEQPPARVSDLMAATGLTRPTVSETLRALEQKGWVTATGAVEGDRGRPAQQYARQYPAGGVIGVDFGFYRIAVTVQSFNAETSYQGWVEPGPTDPIDVRLEATRRAVDEALTATSSDHADIWHMTVATTSMATGDLSTDELQAAVSSVVPFPVSASNGPGVLAGSDHNDRHNDGKDLMFVWLGRQPTISLILKGKPHAGVHGLAGNLAGIDPSQPRSSAAPPFWPPIGMDGTHSYDDRTKAALKDGDREARGDILRWFDAFIPTIVTLSAALDPATVTLGGPIAQLDQELVRRLQPALEAGTPRAPEVRTRPFHEWDVSEAAAVDARLKVTRSLLGRSPGPVLAFDRATYIATQKRRPELSTLPSTGTSRR